MPIAMLGMWLIVVPITAALFIGGPVVIGIVVYRRHMKKINQGKLPENSDQDYVDAIKDLNEEFKVGQVSTEKQISAKDEMKRLLNDD